MRKNSMFSSGIFPSPTVARLVTTTPTSERRLRLAAVAARLNVDIEELVLGVCDIAANKAETAGVRLVVQCEGGAVEGDRAALEGVLLNLVDNAIDATAAGETV